MNIKNRLRKIETETNGPRFCECFRFNEYFDFVQGGGKPADYYRFMPDVCQTCRKTIDKSKESEFLALEEIAQQRLKEATKLYANHGG